MQCHRAVKAIKNYSSVKETSHQGGKIRLVHPRQASAGRCGSFGNMLSGMHGGGSGSQHKHKTSTKRDTVDV